NFVDRRLSLYQLGYYCRPAYDVFAIPSLPEICKEQNQLEFSLAERFETPGMSQSLYAAAKSG
ncbi:MAG: hypothetical protein ACKOUM_06115, partial [Sphingopyxis sp.]